MSHHHHLDPDLPTVITVEGSTNIAPRMRRVRFAGSGVATYLSKPRIPNIKLFFPEPEGQLSLQSIMAAAEAGPEALAEVFPKLKPRVRTYTVRNYNTEEGWMDVDFVRHGSDGLASSWVEHAQAGDMLGVPGGGGRLPAASPWIALVADETGLPATLQILEDLPAEQRGIALIEVAGAEDHLPANAPEGVEVRWIHRGDVPAGTSMALLEEALALEIPTPYEDVFIWAGAEARVVRELRKRVRGLGVPRQNLLIIGYWHQGRTETAYADSSNHDRKADESMIMLDSHAPLADDSVRSLLARR